MAVNWAIGLSQGNAGDAFNQSFQQGMERNKQITAERAMAALVQDPNNPRALAVLAQVDPQRAMQFRQQQLEYHKAQLAEHQDSILKGAEILRQFNPQDQQSYTAALQAAAQAGIDISQVPQEYNPQYVQGVVHLADALKPQTDNSVQNIPVQPGGSVLQYDKRTGQVKQLVVPNDGSQQPGSPVNGQPLTDADILRLKGGQAGSPSPAPFR